MSKNVFLKKIPKDATPIIINNFNRLISLRQQVEWLQSLSSKVAIIIVDNQSTYQPLIQYYEQLERSNIQVVKLHFNAGLWSLPYIVQQLKNYPKYIITDPDLVSYPDTPSDTIQHLSALLDKYPNYNHIGLSIEIEDIPNYYPMQALVKKWEAKFWAPQAQVINNEVAIANVDTTFAMYRQDSKICSFEHSLRVLRPYTLKHVDWYMNMYYDVEGLCGTFTTVIALLTLLK